MTLQAPPNFLRAAALAEYKKPVVVMPDEERQEEEEVEPQPELREAPQVSKFTCKWNFWLCSSPFVVWLILRLFSHGRTIRWAKWQLLWGRETPRLRAWGGSWRCWNQSCISSRRRYVLRPAVGAVGRRCLCVSTKSIQRQSISLLRI